MMPEDEIRMRWKLGGPEANAEIRYVECTQKLPDPPAEGEEGYDPEAIIPYAPVRVKRLKFGDGYAPAAVTIETENSDVTIFTRKSGERHGTRGNNVDVTFEIDSGITGDAEASFDDGDAILAIKVKNDEVLWQKVAEAVAEPVNGAFILLADPAAEVGSAIASETGTLSGGVDGDYEMIGEEFGVGDHDTKDDIDEGDRFFVIYRADSQRWEVLGGVGGGGSVNLKFGVLTSALSAAEGLGTPGEGTVQEKDLATGDDIGGERTIKNPMFTGVLDNYAVWFVEEDGDLWLVKPDCTEAP